MSIKSNIFIWFFLATVLPLTALALGATYYSEYNYERTVNTDISSSINGIATDIIRHQERNRELVLGLATSTAVREILPVLYAARQNKIHPAINVRRARINRFFEGFQTILPGVFYLRILDNKGNTLIKVSNLKRAAAIYDSLSGLQYVEQQIHSKKFVRELKALPKNEVSMLILPHNRALSSELNTSPILDFIVPLFYRKRRVGAMTLTLLGNQLDSILDHAPRLYKGKLFIFENNPDKPKRHGMVLFDDKNKIRLAQQRQVPVYVNTLYSSELQEGLSSSPEGRLASDNGKSLLYYSELYPYVDQLVSWILISRVQRDNITAPFEDIRLGIWIFVGVALFISLILANIGAHKISMPVTMLTKNLTEFADGSQQGHAPTNYDLNEINALARAYNYLADNLDAAQQERDKAHKMVLQSAKLASIGQMAAGIGHEINNPLNNILSYSKLLVRSIDSNSPLKKDLDSLRDEALRASSIVKGILNFARQVAPRYEPFQINPCLQETLALVQQTSKDKNVSIRLLCKEDIVVEGDRGQLQQVLINLLLNAIYASEQDGQIVVSVKTDQATLIVSVRDEGTGIASEKLDKVFDPFFSTKSEGQGSGLGLSISLGIIEYHQGILLISNNQDRGVMATFRIPLVAEKIE